GARMQRLGIPCPSLERPDLSEHSSRPHSAPYAHPALTRPLDLKSGPTIRRDRPKSSLPAAFPSRRDSMRPAHSGFAAAPSSQLQFAQIPHGLKEGVDGD